MNEVIAGLMTPAHHELLERGRRFFHPENLPGWPTFTRAAWRETARAGLLGVSLPTQVGGQGLGVLGSLLLGQAAAELGDGGLLLGLHVQTDVACQWLAETHQSTIRVRYLPYLLDGMIVACQCDTDPSAEQPTIATRRGDDIVIRGEKRFVINGASADLCFVSAQLNGAPALVLVDKQRSGVTVSTVYDKLGTRSVDSARIEFDDVVVPAENLLSRGGIGQTLRWNAVMSRMRFLIAVDAFLMHRRLLEAITARTTTRTLGGRPMAAWPVNEHALARARVDLELMEAGITNALVRLLSGPPPVPEIAQLKWFCVEKATAFAALCCDLEGGAGYMWDSFSLRTYAQLRGLRMAGGSQTTMLTIANHSLSCRAELETDEPARPEQPVRQLAAVQGSAA